MPLDAVGTPGEFAMHAVIGRGEDHEESEIEARVAEHRHGVGLVLRITAQHLHRLGPVHEVLGLRTCHQALAGRGL